VADLTRTARLLSEVPVVMLLRMLMVDVLSNHSSGRLLGLVGLVGGGHMSSGFTGDYRRNRCKRRDWDRRKGKRSVAQSIGHG